jgi:hypothetical protein
LAEDQHRQQIAQEAQREKENRVKQLGFLTGLAIMLVIALILFTNNQQKKKANHLLQVQKTEIETQKEKAETTLEELKIAKNQLENKIVTLKLRQHWTRSAIRPSPCETLKTFPKQ